MKCRICSGEHFTARCPYKDTMAPVDAEGAAIDPLAEDGGAAEKAEGGLGSGGSSYVPPHLRKGGAGAGERMGGKYERDDLATLRVTNVSLWLFLHICGYDTDDCLCRSRRWQRNRTSGISRRSSASSAG